MSRPSSTQDGGAREEILARIRAAWGRDASSSTPEPVERIQQRDVDRTAVVGLFEERIADYKATVWRIPPQETAAKIAEALRSHGVGSVVVPGGLGDDWIGQAREAGIEIRRDDPTLTSAQLNETDGVLTAAKVGIAETGTIVLDHDERQGRRALSLVPDVHVCVVLESQVVADVPEAVSALRESALAKRPLTWISGGSATSDIELSRVEGVHGPRTLHVLLISD